MEKIYHWIEQIIGFSPDIISNLLKSVLLVFGLIIINKVINRFVISRAEDV